MGRNVNPQSLQSIALAVAEARAVRLTRLTPWERQVALLLADGKRSKEIAASLGISTRTAEGHRRQVLRTMEVGSTAQLAAAWFTQRPTAEF
jgi:DNA-binding NarL/FixJ family response regulator